MGENIDKNVSEVVEDLEKSKTSKVQSEIGGPVYPEPTRYGDWERKGRVSDF